MENQEPLAASEPEVVPIVDEISSEPIEGIDKQADMLIAVRPNQQLTAQGLGFSLAASPLAPEQIRAIRAKTPSVLIKDRPGRGGKTFHYIPVEIVKRKLNFTFGYGNWTFKVNKSEVIEDQWVVLGTLRVSFLDDHGNVKQTSEYDNAGGKEIARTKDNKPVDIGDDLKAAIADCLKKCASMTGLFSDVYAPEDWAELKERQDTDQAKIDSQKQEQIDAKKKKILSDVRARLDSCKSASERKRVKEQTVENMKKADPVLWKDEDFASL